MLFYYGIKYVFKKDFTVGAKFGDIIICEDRRSHQQHLYWTNNMC